MVLFTLALGSLMSLFRLFIWISL